MKNLRKGILRLECSVATKWNKFWNDCSGSDTTEKVGNVLVAAVVVGIVIMVFKNTMPELFKGLITKAQSLITADASMPSI